MMSPLSCPRCRQRICDTDLDAGSCPSCGYDGPAVTIGRQGSLWILTSVAVLIGAGALGAYLIIPRPDETRTAARVGTNSKQHVPHREPVPRAAESAEPGLAPLPREIAALAAPDPPPVPVLPANVGPRIVLDPRDVPDHTLTIKLDNPLGTVAIPDLNGHDRITLTGRVNVLRIGSINGAAVIDASELAANEVVVSGDLNGTSTVKLNAPGGKITLGGLVIGQSHLVASAAGGDVGLVAKSGRFGGSAQVAITARRVVIDGLVNEGVQVGVTLTSGGYLRVAVMDGGARLTGKKAAATEPEPKIETGELRNGTKIEFAK